jgi:hypothetical protein
VNEVDEVHEEALSGKNIQRIRARATEVSNHRTSKMIVVDVLGSLLGSLVAIVLALLVVVLTIVQMLVETLVSALSGAALNAKIVANNYLRKLNWNRRDVTVTMTSHGNNVG